MTQTRAVGLAATRERNCQRWAELATTRDAEAQPVRMDGAASSAWTGAKALARCLTTGGESLSEGSPLPTAGPLLGPTGSLALTSKVPVFPTLQLAGATGDSPHARGWAQAAPPSQLAPLPGAIFSIRLPRALALIIVIFLLIIKLLNPVLVADLQQVGVGLQEVSGEGG